MNKRIRWPCVAECKDRFPGCHGSCERYLSAREAHCLDRERERAAESAEQAVLELRIKGAERQKKRQHI